MRLGLRRQNVRCKDQRLCGHRLVGCMAYVLALTASATGEVLYDVPFAAPFQTYGQMVATDLGGIPRQGPSSVNSFAPTTVESYGPFADGAAKFMTAGPTQLSQLGFAIMGPNGVGVDAPGYSLEFDVIPELGTIGDDFAVLFDGPQSNRFSFRGDGLIQYGGGANYIGTFTPGELIHVRVDFFGNDNLWTIIVNDETLYSGSLLFAFTQLNSIRLSLSDTGTFDSLAYVDNVVITAIPAPGALLLVALGLTGASRRRRSD